MSARRTIALAALPADELEMRLLRALVRWHEGLRRLVRVEELLSYLDISRSTWRRLLQQDPEIRRCAVPVPGRVGKPTRWRWLAPAVELRLRETHGWTSPAERPRRRAEP